MISPRTIERRRRAGERDTGVSRRYVVTAINTPQDGDPTVNIKRVDSQRIYELEGSLSYAEPLEVFEIPYQGLITSSAFAFWIPPEVGMEGWFVQTDEEVSEISSGQVNIDRQKDHNSGWFLPSGKLSGAPFQGSSDWAELRGADGSRIALSKDAVHIQAGKSNLCLTDGRFDVVMNGVSLIGALKEMSTHIKALETILLGAPVPRQIDNVVAATCPTRSENGVR